MKLLDSNNMTLTLLKVSKGEKIRSQYNQLNHNFSVKTPRCHLLF